MPKAILNIEQIAAIFDSAPDFLMLFDTKGKAIRLNKLALQLANCDPEQASGMKIGELIGCTNSKNKSQECGLGHLCNNCRLQQAFRDTAQTGQPNTVSDIQSGSIHEKAPDSRLLTARITLLETTGKPLVLLRLEDVTERRRSEEALLRSEQTYREIFNSTSDALFIHDVTGKILDVNDRACVMFGYDRDSFKALPVDSPTFIESPYSRAEEESHLRRTLLEGPQVFEWRTRRSNGELFWTEVALRSCELAGQKRIIAAVRDITSRKQTEEDIQKSAELYHTLFENANDAIFILKDWTFVDCNTLTLQMYGCTREQIIGKKPNEFSPRFQPDGSSSYEKAIENMSAALTGTPQVFEWLHCRLDGSPFYAEVSLNHIPSLGKTALQAIVRDINERKIAETALRESEEKFRRIAERAFDVIIMTLPDGLITYISPSVERVFGYTPYILIGKNVMEFIKESEIPELNDILGQITLGRYIEAKSLHILKADGIWAHVELNTVPVFKDNIVVGAQSIVRDVTETKRLQDLESRAQRLETAGQIAGQVAHDFNNILGPMVAYPELIREMLPQDHPAHSYLEDIEAASDKIADLNQQLLTLSRRGHYNQEVFNLNRVINHAIRDMGQLPESLVVELDLSSDLMNIRGGNAQVYRVIMNLLANACDAVGNNGKVSIKTENVYIDQTIIGYGRVLKGEFVKVTIADTGKGIPADIIQRIFDPFFTTKSTDKKRGSGLGLSVVDAVMRDHGGYIDLKTKVDEGSVFYLYFPITHDSVNDIIDTKVIGGNESILVVDDDEVQRAVLNNLLTKLGYKVATCDNGESAVKLLQNNPQDLLILDMVMPYGIDGAETYRQILISNPNQKAIIVSGFSETNRVREAQAMGAGAFVRKPLNKKILASAVRKALDEKKKIADQPSLPNK